MDVEKLITEDDFETAMAKGLSVDEIFDLVRSWNLQELKAKQTIDTEFEIIQPKQLK